MTAAFPWGKPSLPTSPHLDYPMKIIFSEHAELKFKDLEKQGFKIAKGQVEDAINMPQDIIESTKGR